MRRIGREVVGYVMLGGPPRGSPESGPLNGGYSGWQPAGQLSEVKRTMQLSASRRLKTRSRNLLWTGDLNEQL